jgi:dolichol-phosphate mannosyltransferase
MKISVVTPAYKCSECIEELYRRLKATFDKMSIDDYEIVYVNDASPDNDWEIISKIAKKDSKVKGINLSRNFGQHRAITAGLDYAAGDHIVVMDCDLQDQPEEIVKLYAKIQEGYDVVFGRRYERKDKFLKKFFSKSFNMVFTYLTGRKVDNTVANFSIISKKVLNELKNIREQNRSYGLFLLWLGFDTAYVDIEHSRRYKGESSYTFKKALDFAMDIAVSHSNKPLKIFIKFGFSISFLSFLYGLYLIFKYFVYNTPLQGWTSMMVSLYFIGGLILANLGIVGLYIGKIFDEVKKRPIYSIKDKKNFKVLERGE